MDDILIYSKTLEEHVKLLKEVLQILSDNQFCIKRSKCSFAKQRVEYLGHVVSVDGVAIEPAKVEAVKNWLVPRNLKQLRGFLGLTGCYRKFIAHYGMISHPLIALLKKNTHFSWLEKEEQAFSLLKQKLTQAPVLAVPDFNQEFVVETDACEYGIGAVLMQNGHHVAYLSKALCPKN